MLLDPLLQINFLCKFLIIGCTTLSLRNSTVKHLNICEDQLVVNRLNITDRIDASIYVDYIGILKAAYYMNDCIDFTDVCKELISKTLSLRSALYKSCNVNKFYNSRCHLR